MFELNNFSRTIKKACDRKPLDIIREYVILDAKSLLLTGRYSVKEVSEKLATGKSPLEFLKSAQNHLAADTYVFDMTIPWTLDPAGRYACSPGMKNPKKVNIPQITASTVLSEP